MTEGNTAYFIYSLSCWQGEYCFQVVTNQHAVHSCDGYLFDFCFICQAYKKSSSVIHVIDRDTGNGRIEEILMYLIVLILSALALSQGNLLSLKGI